LSPAALRLFRLLGLMPGPDISLAGAASLAGLDMPQTDVLLAELATANLIDQPEPGRFTCHDLLRDYAAELAATHDSPAERQAAVARLMAFYLRMSYRSSHRLRRFAACPPPVPPGVAGVPEPTIAQALTWLATERRTLIRMLEWGAGIGHESEAWQIAWAVKQYIDRLGYWSEAMACLGVGLDAARRTGDLLGQAMCLRGLAHVDFRTGQVELAAEHLSQAADLFQGMNMVTEERSTRFLLAYVAADPVEKLRTAEEMVAWFERSGRPAAGGYLLNNAGWILMEGGRYARALELCTRALAYQPEGSDGRALTADSLGMINYRLGRYEEAISWYRDATKRLIDLADVYMAARTLMRLGDACRDAGDLEGAREAWRESLNLIGDDEHPDAPGTREKLAQI